MRKLKAIIRLALSKRWHSNRVLLIKSIVYCLFSIIIMFLLAFLETRNFKTSMAIGFLSFYQVFIYFTFELNWKHLIQKI